MGCVHSSRRLVCEVEKSAFVSMVNADNMVDGTTMCVIINGIEVCK